MTDRVDCIVIGAGVVGLAVARTLALAGREVVVLERESLIGSITSARNSEVIHAGIYYPKDSLKARACVAGKALLYRYCADHGVGHSRCGKLIVASDPAQVAELASIRARAAANGVTDLIDLAGADVRQMEPEIEAVAALLSPSTGIVDSHGLMLALQGEAEAHGAMIAFETNVTAIDATGTRPVIRTGGADSMALECNWVVNAAGLSAPLLAGQTDGLSPDHVPTAWFAKGNYFVLGRKSPFNRLIYPVPEPGGLGIHVTIDLQGQARFGPDVEWLSDIDDPRRIDYRVDPDRGTRFRDAIRRYWPALRDDDLLPGYSGVRPKISGPGAPAADFRIEGPETHGCAGLVNMLGIESPGLTSSLALAEMVAGIVGVGASTGGT